MNSTTRTNPWRRAGYIASFLMVAGVAARVSYSHIRDVALYGHQPHDVAALLPLAVDGMMLIATLAMAEDKAADRRPRGWARTGFWFGASVSTVANVAATVVAWGWSPLPMAVAALAPILLLWAIEIVSRPGKPRTAPVVKAAAVTPAVAPLPVVPAPVVPVPAPVVQAQQVVAQTSAAMPVPVSPAAPVATASTERRTTGSGPIPRRTAVSPLTGGVLADRAPRV